MENERNFYINLLFQALENFKENPDAVENFKSYLDIHFYGWCKNFAYCPTGFISELYNFSNIK